LAGFSGGGLRGSGHSGPELSKECEYVECGTLWIAADEEELDEARRKCDFAMARGVVAEVIDGSELARLEPCLRSGLAGALLVPHDGVVYAPVAAGWLLEQAVQCGAVYRNGTPVEAIEHDGVRFGNGDVWHGGVIVNAAGADAPRLTPGLPVVPRKGHLAITDRAPGFIRHQIVELGYLKSAHSTTADSVAFNLCPRPTGQVLIGSSRHYGATDSAIDHRILRAMLQRAFEYAPALRDLSAIRCWAGFRAATPDKVPLIGPHPSLKNLWLATGHEGLGITTALATAKLLAAQITGVPCSIPTEPYLPGRFAAGEGEKRHE
jgi:glycine/D-amino acid oxidase-like deaminating enzyme